jgi:TonB family protein
MTGGWCLLGSLRRRGAALCALAAIGFVPLTRARAAPLDVVPPKRLDVQEVPYPAGASGDSVVVLAVVVDETGAVTAVDVREGASPFSDRAAESVRTWRFAPATRGGVPIRARILATVKFHAPEVQPPPPPQRVRVAADGRDAAAPPPPIEVSVHAEREEPSTIHIPRSETRFVAGAFGDPLRAVEVLPGMAPWLSGLPYYYVRGSPPESVGYFIDGIRVPLLFHVGPGASTIAPALVESVDLFPGAYPSEYGRYAGAVIAAKTTSPEVDAPHGEFGARVYDANASVETPFDHGQGSAFAAGRYAYTQALTSIIVPHYSLGYWDYQVRVAHRVGDAGTLALLAFGAHDELHYYGEPTFRVEYHRADLRYDHALSGGHVRVAATFQYDDTLTAVQTNTGAGTPAALRGIGGRLRAEVDEGITPEARVRAGADAIVTRYPTDDFPATDGYAGFDGSHTDVEAGAYADVVWRPARGVELVPGFRVDGYQTRGRTAWAPQPRLAARVRIFSWLSWLSAVGTAHQEPTEEVFVPAKLPNPEVQSSQTIYQFSEALDMRLPSALHLRLTGFYASLLAQNVEGTGDTAHGQSGGLEVFLRREFTERLGGFVSYTLARTVASNPRDPRNGEQRVSWDRTHVASVVLGYDFGNGWRGGARVFVESGRPWPPVCLNCPPTGSTLAPPLTFTPRGNLPVFWRLDVRLEKRWEFRHGAWFGLTLECFNTFDKAEPTDDTWAPGRGVVTRYQAPIILPSVGLEGGF